MRRPEECENCLERIEYVDDDTWAECGCDAGYVSFGPGMLTPYTDSGQI